MAERMMQPPGITQGDMGPRYTRKRLSDEVYIGHYIKAGDRIRVRSTILTGVIASLTTVNLTIGGRVQGMDGDLVPFGDSLTFAADGAQTARYVMAPEGYVVDLIVESTSTGLVSGDLTVVVDIVQGTGSNAVAVGLLAYGYVYPAGLLGLNVSRNIGGGGGGVAIGGAVTSGTAGSVLFVGTGPVLAQDNTNFFWDDTLNLLSIQGLPLGNVYKKTTVLTDAQIKALPTTPVTLVAAQGASTIVLPLFVLYQLNTAAGAYTNVSVTNQVTPKVGGQSVAYGVSPVGFDAAGNVVFFDMLGQGLDATVATLANQTLTVTVSNPALGNFTGGNAANTLTVHVYYVVLPV